MLNLEERIKKKDGMVDHPVREEIGQLVGEKEI